MRKKAQDTFRDSWLGGKKSPKANQCVASHSVRFAQSREKAPQKNLQDKILITFKFHPEIEL